MPTSMEVTDPNLSQYVPPPAAGAGVCLTCHGASGVWDRCASCKTCREAVGHPLDLVVPVSLTRTDERAQLYNVLRDYKNVNVRPDVQSDHRLHVGALLVRFLGEHRPCIARAAGRDYDTITIVPSKNTRREGTHPLEQAIQLGGPLKPIYAPLLEDGPGRVGRNAPAEDGFVATGDAAGRRVLLVDDTLTSIASLQSAAHALTIGGADVVAGVVLGRVIRVEEPRPTDRPEVVAIKRARTELWERQSRTPFNFARCCLE